MNERISNAITKLKNAARSGHEVVTIPFSSIMMNALSVMQKKGHVESFTKKGKKVVKFIEVRLAHNEKGQALFSDIKLISKSSKRVYRKAVALKKVKNGYGYSIVSTSSGVMTGDEAKASGVGGEVLFEIW
jgi:small subunit ribosomal protein S8